MITNPLKQNYRPAYECIAAMKQIWRLKYRSLHGASPEVMLLRILQQEHGMPTMR